MDRYIFFPACGERFGRPGQSLLELETDESPEDALERVAQVCDNDASWCCRQDCRACCCSGVFVTPCQVQVTWQTSVQTGSSRCATVVRWLLTAMSGRALLRHEVTCRCKEPNHVTACSHLHRCWPRSMTSSSTAGSLRMAPRAARPLRRPHWRTAYACTVRNCAQRHRLQKQQAAATPLAQVQLK